MQDGREFGGWASREVIYSDSIPTVGIFLESGSWEIRSRPTADLTHLSLYYQLNKGGTEATWDANGRRPPRRRLHIFPPATRLTAYPVVPYEAHSYIALSIASEWARFNGSIAVQRDGIDWEAFSSYGFPFVENIMSRMARCLSRDRVRYRKLILSLAAVVESDLEAYFEDVALKAASGVVTCASLSPKQLGHIGEIVTNSDTVPSVERLATELGMASTELRRLYYRATGRALQRDLGRLRLEMAANLLRDTAMPLKQVSHKIGYAHTSTFTQAFKGKYGVTPNWYRRSSPLRPVGLL